MDESFQSVPQAPPPPPPVEPQSGYHVVKNCVYNTEQMAIDGTCPGGLTGKGGGYERIDVNDLIQEPITTTSIGYKVISNNNTTDAETAVRCYTDTPTTSGDKVYSVPGSIGKSYTEAKQICQNLDQDGSVDWRLPQNLDEVGAACGSGMGYDGNYIWMDECYTLGAPAPACAGSGGDSGGGDSGGGDSGGGDGSGTTPGTVGGYKLIRNCKWGGGHGYTAPPHGVINEEDLLEESVDWLSSEYVYGDIYGFKIYDAPDYDHPDSAMRCVTQDGKSGVSYPMTGHSYNAAKEYCDEQDMRLPKNSEEAAKTCGTGYGYDGYAMWVDEGFVFG